LRAEARVIPAISETEPSKINALQENARFPSSPLGGGRTLGGMTQSSVTTWAEGLQRDLMAALEAAWATIRATDDPAVLRKARDKVRACGDLAAMARKVVALTGFARPKPAPGLATASPEPASPEPAAVLTQAEHALRALELLKARHRR